MRTLVIRQEHATVVPLFDGGESYGDAMAFEGPIAGPDGLAGVIVGVLHTAHLHEGTGSDRIGTAVFSFGGDDSISVGGVTSYQSDQSVSAPGTRRPGAVIGGTGQFIGARGERESVRNEDGSWTHTFTLL
jgi:hypothetical protein